MKREEKKDILMNIRIEESLKNEYAEFCEQNGYSLSKRIRLFMEKDLKGKIEIKK